MNNQNKALAIEHGQGADDTNAERLDPVLSQVDSIVSTSPESRMTPSNRRHMLSIAEMARKEIEPMRQSSEQRERMDTATTIKIAEDFYNYIGADYGERATQIINGKELSVRLNINDGRSVVNTVDGTSIVNVELGGITNDCYTLVHELAHTFELAPTKDGNNPTKELLGEVAPICMERILSRYLEKNGEIPLLDIQDQDRQDARSAWQDTLETYIKLKLLDDGKITPAQNGQQVANCNLSWQDIGELQSELELTNDDAVRIFERMDGHSRDGYISYRYMIAGLFVPMFMQQYDNNPGQGIENLKKWQSCVRNDKLEDALKILDFNVDSIN